MIRKRRRWLAVWVMLGVVFAQIVTAAHACVLVVPVSHAVALVQSAGDSMPSDCGAMEMAAAADAKVCESHCAHGQQIDLQPDAPVAAIAPQLALTVDVASSTAPRSFDKTFIYARSNAPPVSILFSRFLS